MTIFCKSLPMTAFFFFFLITEIDIVLLASDSQALIKSLDRFLCGRHLWSETTEKKGTDRPGFLSSLFKHKSRPTPRIWRVHRPTNCCPWRFTWDFFLTPIESSLIEGSGIRSPWNVVSFLIRQWDQTALPVFSLLGDPCLHWFFFFFYRCIGIRSLTYDTF